MPYFKSLPVLLLMIFVLPACSALGVATGVGATVGLSAAQEGGLSRAASDALIQAEINNAWFNYDVDVFTKLDITVNKGRVLVTGVVQEPQHRVDAIRLIWQVGGVKQVINEVQVAESSGISGFLQDQWILTRLRTKITLDKEIQSLNYNIDSVNGTVYLLGVAQDQVELNKVIEGARTISGVRQVVSYVKIAGPKKEDDIIEPFERTYRTEDPNYKQPATSYQEPVYQQPAYQEPNGNVVIDAPDNYAPVQQYEGEEIIWNNGQIEASQPPRSLNGVETQSLE